MKHIDNLYKRLIVSQDPSGHTAEVNKQIRSKLYKTILDDIKKLRKKQSKVNYISEKYEKLDYEIRLRLLKETQAIVDEYVVASESGNLKSWKAMYGDIEYYIKNFFYYRIDGKYEAKKKTLRDYKFLDEETLRHTTQRRVR
jgi:hypothetical protein